MTPPPSLPPPRQGCASFHHPSFSNHFGFLGLLPPGNSSLLATGLRDSFPGFPSFGHFPSFHPGEETAMLRPRDKNQLSKSRSTTEYGASKEQGGR